MLMFGIDVPVWVLLSMVLTALFLWWSIANYGIFRKMGVPYRTPLPLIGNSLDLFTTSIPELEMLWSKKLGKVYGQFDGWTPNLVVMDADFLKQFTIKNFSSFSNRRKFVIPNFLFQHMLTVLDDDHWKHVRNSLTPVFTSGKLKQMISVINDCGDRFITHLDETNSAPFTVKDYTSGYTMDVIASTGFGIEIDSQKDVNHPFLRHAGVFFGGGPAATKYTMVMQALRFILARAVGFEFVPSVSTQYFNEIVSNVLDQRMESDAEKRPDVVQTCVDKLVDVEKVDKSTVRETNGMKWTTEGLTRGEIVSNAVLFLVAGYETTATTLQFFFYQMALLPEIQEKLHEHIKKHSPNDKVTYEELNKMDYLDQCLHEVMRIFPPLLSRARRPLPLSQTRVMENSMPPVRLKGKCPQALARFDRVASEDTVINGVSIPKGMVVSAGVYAIHHNPDYWPEPETFKPERFAPENKEEHHQYTWLPFGIGNRNCIGMRLALLEVKLGIVKIMKNYVIEKSASTLVNDQMEFKVASGFLVPKKKLELRAVPRDTN